MLNKINIQLLPKPIPITEQNWPEGTVPLVSICCITYNHERFIRECLDGFLMQETTFPVEILIHDDASTDKTADIIREYESKYPKLMKPIYQVENQYSQGCKPNIYFNFPRAKGKYIATCDGDDFWVHPNKLQIQIEFIKETTDCSLCFHDSNVVDADGNYRSNFSGRKDEICYSFKDCIQSNFIPSSSRLFRNGNYYKPVLFSKILAADWGLNLLIAEKGNVVYLPFTMSSYRIHASGVWSKLSNIQMIYKGIETLIVLDNYYKKKYHDDFVKSIKARKQKVKRIDRIDVFVKRNLQNIYKFIK